MAVEESETVNKSLVAPGLNNKTLIVNYDKLVPKAQVSKDVLSEESK